MGKRESVSLMMQCAGKNESMTSSVSVVGPAMSVLLAAGVRPGPQHLRYRRQARCVEDVLNELLLLLYHGGADCPVLRAPQPAQGLGADLRPFHLVGPCSGGSHTTKHRMLTLDENRGVWEEGAEGG